MPRRGKGQKYTPALDLLLHDALPTWREIDGEQDARKRRERIRARDLAIDDLLKMYWNLSDVGQRPCLMFAFAISVSHLTPESWSSAKIKGRETHRRTLSSFTRGQSP